MAFNLDSLLVGSSKKLNETLAGVNSLKDKAKAQFADVTIDASAIKSAVEGEVTGLVGKLSAMLPELPTIPNLNAQSAFAGLADLDPTAVAGIKASVAKVKSLKESFGGAIDITDSLVEQVKAGVDVGSLMPNIELGIDGKFIELPAGISFSTVAGKFESLKDIVDFPMTIDNDTLKELGGYATDAVEELNKQIGKVDDFSIVIKKNPITEILEGKDDLIGDIKKDLIKKFTPVTKKDLTLT